MAKANNIKPAGFMASCKRAGKGIAYSLKTEKHLRFHFFMAILVAALGLFLQIARVDWLFIIYAVGSVVTAELFNTSMEKLVDLTQTSFHPLAGLAKDIASGAVLFTALQAVIIGLFVFIPYLNRLF